MLLFDRQILYLVFLFGSTAHAAPARRPSTNTSASLDDSPSLTLDISPQLISSAGNFASQLASAVFAEGSASTSLSSIGHVLDDTSISSSRSYSSEASQTTGIAAPSDPKNPAVTSTTSTFGRSRTRVSPSLETASASSPSPSPQPITAQGRPQLSQSAEGQHTSPHHTTYPSSGLHGVGAHRFSNFSSLNGTMDNGPGAATMTGATNTAAGIDGLLAAIGQVGALSGSDPAAATGLAAATDNEQPTNALDVLISALPTSIAAPIQSEFSDVIDPIGSAINSFTNDVFGAGGRTSLTQTRPTRTPPTTIPSTSPSTSEATTTIPTTTPTPLLPPTTTTDSSMSTMLTRPSDTSSDAPPAPPFSTEPGSSAAHPLENASTIGIATGVSSGAVLLFVLGGLYLWRRKQQGKPWPFARGGSKRSNRVYPEVAWLYDPDITPSRSRAGSGSGEHLVPEPRPGSVEIGGTPLQGGRSPEMRPTSPLLAPVVRGSRDMVGSRSRSGSEVDFDRLRPLSTLREETPRGSMS